MSAAADSFADYLVMQCEEDDGTEFLDDLHALAKAEIMEGNGSVGFMASASANGKSFTFNQALTCVEVATACLRAKRLYNDTAGSGPITFIDFSRA